MKISFCGRSAEAERTAARGVRLIPASLQGAILGKDYILMGWGGIVWTVGGRDGVADSAAADRRHDAAEAGPVGAKEGSWRLFE